ncbi:hypothetical protein [Streptomyces chartreusis]|uniref:hypothetical protein n=1 Tax=Streptomyces chartreusis TaxID=1969 RepID=UPI0038006434
MPDARLVSSPALWGLHLAQGRRNELCNWLRANGLDPLSVLSTHDIVIEDASGSGWRIRCMVIEKDAVRPQERIVPLAVPPPRDWPVAP